MDRSCHTGVALAENRMTLPLVKTYAPGSDPHPLSFYILNKGKNSGRPMEQPCPNCFEIRCCSVEERDTFYWMAYSLWQSRYYYPHLKGSVIDYIRIRDVRDGLAWAASRFPDPQVIIVAAVRMKAFQKSYNELLDSLAKARMLRRQYLAALLK